VWWRTDFKTAALVGTLYREVSGLQSRQTVTKFFSKKGRTTKTNKTYWDGRECVTQRSDVGASRGAVELADFVPLGSRKLSD
jgi:hypothetical protein